MSISLLPGSGLRASLCAAIIGAFAASFSCVACSSASSPDSEPTTRTRSHLSDGEDDPSDPGDETAPTGDDGNDDDGNDDERPSTDAPDGGADPGESPDGGAGPSPYADPTSTSDTSPSDNSRTTDVGVTSPTGTLVPLYVYPSGDAWKPLIEQKLAHPSVDVVATVNPDSGPGTVVKPAYASGIHDLVDAGIRTIGYVSTEHGNRDALVVKNDIDAWARLYPDVSGIFFDEQDNQAVNVPYYRDVAAYAKSKGYTLTVGNPGTMWTDAGYFAALDVILVYEKDAMPNPDEMKAKLSSVSREQCAISPYAVSMLDTKAVQTATTWVKYVYVTDRLYQENPWAGLPPYLGDLFDALDPSTTPTASP
jgi:hypothetical protein